MEKFRVFYYAQNQNLVKNIYEAMEWWKAFCQLPVKEKKKVGYKDGVGYEVKDVQRFSHDRKEDLHFTLRAWRDIWVQGLSLDSNTTLNHLLQNSFNITLELEEVVVRHAKMLEDRFGVTGLVNEVKDSRDSWILRFLHYFPERQFGEEIALPHPDKCGFTLHLYESDGGLQFLPYDEEGKPYFPWLEMPMVPRMSAVIPSMQLQRRTEGRIRALYHRVVADNATTYIGRYSMVCFIPFNYSHRWNKEANGRLQEFPIGFNYTMPYEEFQKLFV